MTARRGSLRYKIVRLSRMRDTAVAKHAKRFKSARIAAAIASRALMVLVAAFISVTIAAQVWHAAARNVALHRQIVATEDANAKLQAENGRLAQRITLLHEPEYLVPLIHEQLGLTKPNEVFIEVAPATPAPNPQP
jgi:cell division protein FtsB